MAQQVRLETRPRTEFGKGSARRIRREDWIPAVVYGTDRTPAHISVPGHDLMMALKTAQVILEVDVDGEALNVAPKQVQRDPVKQVIEHVDLLVLSQKEVRERLVVGAAVAKAEAAAAEAELDSVTVVMAVRELLDEGMDADAAIAQAIETVKEQMEAQAQAAAAAAAAEEAAEAAAAEEGAEATEAGGDSAAAGDEGSANEG